MVLISLPSSLSLTTYNDDSKTRCDPVSGKESLDVIIENIKATRLFKDFLVGLDVGSDHFPVLTILQFKNQLTETPRYIRRIKNLNSKKWEQLLNKFPMVERSENAIALDAKAELVTNQIIAAFKESCPEKRVTKRSKCEFTPEIRACVKEKRKLWRQKNNALLNDNHVLARHLMTQMNRLGNTKK